MDFNNFILNLSLIYRNGISDDEKPSINTAWKILLPTAAIIAPIFSGCPTTGKTRSVAIFVCIERNYQSRLGRIAMTDNPLLSINL